MTQSKSNSSGHDRPPPSGVPLGGVGAGCIELGQDAVFRNVTINNNRTSGSRIPYLPNAFLAVTAKDQQDKHTRILQPATNLPFQQQGIQPTYTSAKEQTWQGLYPRSTYLVEPTAYPLRIKWTALSPVIPYDLEAAILPTVVFMVELHNPHPVPWDAATMLHWENIRGCNRDTWPEERGSARHVYYDPVMEQLAPEPATDKAADVGMTFAMNEPCTENPHGSYALVGMPGEQLHVSRRAWDHRKPEQFKSLWASFEDKHDLGLDPILNADARHGAVCIRTSIAPGETKRFTFVLSWHCPVYVVNGEDLGNFYTTEYTNAMEVAEYTLKHTNFFRLAIFKWQEQFLKSTLPQWYVHMLINSSHVLSTNTLYTNQGEFAMMETPADPITGVTDRSLYSSIGTLLFFPNLADRELMLLSATEETDSPGRIFRDLGKGTVREPGYGPGQDEIMDVGAAFVLMAYRNFHMTGRLVSLMSLYPRLQKTMETAMEKDKDGDGIPDVHGDATTFRGWAVYGLNIYNASLWVAAMVAYADLARQLKHEEEARKYEDFARKALQSIEKRLWNKEQNHYRLYYDSEGGDDHPQFDDACQAAQLVGPWLAEFLKLGGWFPHRRTQEALKSILRINARPGGLCNGARSDSQPCTNPPTFPVEPQADKSWPGFDTTYIASLEIYHGYVDLGMELLKQHFKRLYGSHQLMFNHPLSWDPIDNKPTGWRHDRHMSSMAVWHSLFAIQGFFLSVPRKTISLMPRLPKGVHQLAAPVFTPVTFGWMQYQVTQEPKYEQRVRIDFSSPVTIQTIQLSVPHEMTRPKIRLFVDEEPLSFQAETKPNQTNNELNIYLKEPLLLQQPIQVHVS